MTIDNFIDIIINNSKNKITKEQVREILFLLNDLQDEQFYEWIKKLEYDDDR